jgi:O-acetyl-ADP-ribose deacetylase (regulator of RNase III)
MRSLSFQFVDTNPDVVTALRNTFSGVPDVTVAHGDILSVAHDCVVSPANSYGYTDGGIDRSYRHYFGPEVEETVRNTILKRPEGYLPVGASIVVATGDSTIPYMIVAPTMMMPEAVPVSHISRAFQAVVRVYLANRHLIQTVFCPGLGTGVGAVPPMEAAHAMADVYTQMLSQ